MDKLTDAQITAGAAVLCDCPTPKRIGRNAAIDVFDAMTGAAQPQVGAPVAQEGEQNAQAVFDADYIARKLKIIVRDLSYYTSQELARDLVRMAKVANANEALKEAAPSSTAASAQAAPVIDPAFLANLQRSRAKYPNNASMLDGLCGELHELKRAYNGDGDVRAEAFDVAVCAYRLAVEGDAGGNQKLDLIPDSLAWGAPAASSESVDTPELRTLISKYERAFNHSTIPETSRAWAALIAHIESLIAARVAQAAPAVRAQLEEQIIEGRIAITPEYEGGFHALIYGDEAEPHSKGYGKTPSEAIAAARRTTSTPADDSQPAVGQKGGAA